MNSISYFYTNNFFRLFFLLVFTLIIHSAGCSQKPPVNPSPPAVSYPTPVPETSPITPHNKPDENSAGESENPGKDDSGDEDSENLDDMYIRIYGEENVSYRNETPYFDENKAYAHILNSPAKSHEIMYRDFMKRAGEMEEAGNFAEAVGLYRKADFIERRMKSGVAGAKSALKRIRDKMLDKASDFFKKRKFEEALPFADIAVLCDPSYGESLKLAGLIFSETGDEGMGILYLSAAVTKLKKDYELRHKLKNLYLLEGMPEKALPLIDENSARYGRLRSADEERACAYLMIYIKSPSKRKEMTFLIRDSLKRAIEYKSGSAPALAELKINLSLFDKKYEETIKHCNERLKMDIPSYIRIRLIYNKGLLYHLLGDRKNSIKYLNLTIDEVLKGEKGTQGENYMAQMSCWFLDIMGERVYTPEKAERIYSKVFNPDYSYRQEYGFIKEYLENRERKNYPGALDALKKYTEKRHLEPVGNFVEDLLQIPAQKALIYISTGEMYRLSGDGDNAAKCFDIAGEEPFLAREILRMKKNIITTPSER